MPDSVWEEVQDKRGGVTFNVVKSYSRETRILAEQLLILERKMRVLSRRLYFHKGFILVVINDSEFTRAIVAP